MNYTEDKVSIIVPFHSLENYLDFCLKSIQNQTYKNIEVILLANNVEDNSLNIAKKYVSRDNRFLLYEIPYETKNISEIRNYALQFVTGKYFTFVDGDDTVFPNFIQVLYDNIQKSKSELSVCRLRKTKTLSISKLKKIKNKFFVIDKTSFNKSIFESNKYGGYLTNKLFITSLAKGLRFNERCRACEDLHFLNQYLKHCNNVCITNDKLYCYTIRKGSIIHSVGLKFGIKIIRALNEIAKDSKRDEKLLPYVLCWRARQTCGVILSNSKKLKKQKYDRLNILFANYIEMSYKQKKDLSSLSKLIISFYYHKYKRFLKNK